ncbi:efflux RND transporter permease subunit [Saccharicrinis aurantiacus]|uniref:efflux RND transporter permease subunit n=1 Tax=Saccharicrinis aurantiacus TaxID=1849719 RepID=UPI00248F5DA1|nr:efflux RND transporter permease subunit [Saccharicrinis aurantiacus]
MKKLIEYFIKFPLAVNLIMGFIVIFGIIALLGIQKNFFPNVPTRNIYVDILFPGASPEEVEEGAILKIEENVKGLEGMDRITSVSRENTGTVTIEMLKGTDMDEALVDVKNAVDRIASFPAAIESVVTYKHDDVNRAMSFVITPKEGQDVTLHQLKDVSRQIEHDMLKMKGVSKIEIGGYPDEEVAILLNEEKLESYQLTFTEIARAVASANLIMTGGSVKDGQEEFFIRVRNKEYHSDGIENIVIKSSPNNGIIRLKDVATIKDQWADTPSQVLFNGKKAVVFEISNTFEEDIIISTDQIKEYLEEFNQSQHHLKGVINNDMSVTLNQRIDLLNKNGITGIILVVIFLSLFLNPRIAFWVALGIPISIFGMFILLPATTATINMLSLFGLILVLGILVDDAIVVAENVFRHWQMGKKPIKAAIDGTLEVTPAVVSGVITTMMAFSTFIFLDGRMGDMFKEISIIVIFILFVSLIEGLIILPSHLAHSKAMQNHSETKWNKYMGWAERGIVHFANHQFKAILKWTIKHRTITMAIFTALMILSVGMVSSRTVATTFFPDVEGDNFTVTLGLPAGTEDAVTQAELDRIFNAVWQVNDELQQDGTENISIIKQVFQRFMGAGNSAIVQVQLQDAELRTSTTDEVINRIRNIVGDIPGAETLQYSGFNPFGKAIVISLVGDDNKELQLAKEKIKLAMKSRPEVTDISDNTPIGNREIEITLKEKAHLLGVSVQDVIGQVREAFWGNEAQRLQRGKDEVKVWVKYDIENRRSIGQLENMKVRLSDGKAYPLSELATLKTVNGISSIRHLDFDKEVQIEANMTNARASLPDIIAGLQKDVFEPIFLEHPSVSAVYDGQKRETDKVANSAKTTIPVVLLLMFGIVLLTLRSVSQSILVYGMIPLSFVGVVFGHWIHGMSISLMSFMGIIALVGVMINDALVLINALNINLKDGMKYQDALINAGVSRLRPIILTTLTTVVGMMPMLLETSMQARFLIPVAISLAYGMMMATTTTLILLPVMLTIVNNSKVSYYSLIKGRKVTNEEIESAIKELDFEKENE